MEKEESMLKEFIFEAVIPILLTLYCATMVVTQIGIVVYALRKLYS